MKKLILKIFLLLVSLGGITAFIAIDHGKGSKELHYRILQKWELPEVLNEVSGIEWIAENQIAAVQDEEGAIYIYNIETSELEDLKIPFSGNGDYEGLTTVGDDAFVLRSDGTLYQVNDYLKGNKKVKEIETFLSTLDGIDLEGLCADIQNNRLLLAVKERKGNKETKEIFSYSLKAEKLQKEPLFEIALKDAIFEDIEAKLEKKFTPGEIEIHPVTGEIYVLDGTEPKLLILTKDGGMKELYHLDANDFGNPEGITFSPDGTLYISNEAENKPANILKVQLEGQTN